MSKILGLKILIYSDKTSFRHLGRPNNAITNHYFASSPLVNHLTTISNSIKVYVIEIIFIDTLAPSRLLISQQRKTLEYLFK